MALTATRAQFSRNLTSGWLTLAAEVAVGMLLTPFVVTRLGVAAYGLWALMIGLIGYLGLVDVGIRGSVGRYVNHYLALADRRALDEVVGTSNVVLTGLSAAAVLLAFAVGANFAAIFPKTPPGLVQAAAFCLPLLALGLWIAFVTSVLGNLLAAREASWLSNGINVIVLAVRAAGTVAALLSGHGLQALVLVTVGASALGLLLTWIAVRHTWLDAMPRLVGFSAERLKEMWRFGISAFAGRTASTFGNDSAPIIGMWVLGPEAVAVYSVAATLTQYSKRLIDHAGNAIYPSVMKLGAVGDREGLRTIYLRYMSVSFAIGSLVFIGMMAFSHAFLGLWVGPAYQAGAWVVAIVAFGYLMQGVASTSILTLQGMGRVHTTAVIGIVEALACIVLTAALPLWFGLGLVGMALGATLPRLVTSCIVAPWLAAKVIGSELSAPMRSAAAGHLLNSLGIALLFGAIALLWPVRGWADLVGAVGAAVLLHIALLGPRYEISGAGAVHDWLVGHWRRLQRSGGA
jgi:O-antigen/teichoic acid export membrane protein